ncbi:MAG TPA: hypothetical protein P5534_08705 [Candidatus Paceibacterota bacterium]|nr:hypothetical protein [Candidatus Paceibacterota bacterium]
MTKRCSLDLSAIKTHQQVNRMHTRCPGKFFDLKAVLGARRRA